MTPSCRVESLEPSLTRSTRARTNLMYADTPIPIFLDRPQKGLILSCWPIPLLTTMFSVDSAYIADNKSPCRCSQPISSYILLSTALGGHQFLHLLSPSLYCTLVISSYRVEQNSSCTKGNTKKYPSLFIQNRHFIQS